MEESECFFINTFEYLKNISDSSFFSPKHFKECAEILHDVISISAALDCLHSLTTCISLNRQDASFNVCAHEIGILIRHAMGTHREPAVFLISLHLEISYT